MGIDFNFNNFDFGDYVIRQENHDVVVDVVNSLNRIITESSDDGSVSGEIESISFEPEANEILIRAVINLAEIELTDIQALYSCRLWGGHIILRPENEMEFSVTIVMEGCFDEK